MAQRILYDAGNECVIQLSVTTVESDRAHSVMDFAAKSLAKAFQETVKSEEQQKESICRWTYHTTLLLLETYRSQTDSFMPVKTSHKKIWEHIAQTLSEKGHSVSGPQCASKLHTLKKRYKRIKNREKISGNDRHTWEFYNIMDEMFDNRGSCKGIVVASSSGMNTMAAASDSTTSDTVAPKECNNNEPSTSSNAVTLLKKMIEQEEEMEVNKERRHKEKMDMKRKLVEVLQELTNKK